MPSTKPSTPRPSASWAAPPPISSGTRVAEVGGPEDPLAARCRDCAATGLPVQYEASVEDRRRHADRRRVSSRRSCSATAPRPMLIGISRDITAQRRAEEQLRQAQKMEAIGQLTGGIAHDFNNLLTGIIGSLALMQKRVAQGRTDTVERYAGLAMASANRAAALTHRLLAFSRRQPLEAKARRREPAWSPRWTTCSAERWAKASSSRASRPPGLWLTLCDPHQLENALLNLAINARDAMPDGGRLTVGTANAVLDASASAEPGDYVALFVGDTGTGMPPDVIARAFDPFFTTKPIGQGTGLGLSMIYGFVKQSGGHIGDRFGTRPRHDDSASSSRGTAVHGRRRRARDPARPHHGRGTARRYSSSRTTPRCAISCARSSRISAMRRSRRSTGHRGTFDPRDRATHRSARHRRRVAGHERTAARRTGPAVAAGSQGAVHHGLRRECRLRERPSRCRECR